MASTSYSQFTFGGANGDNKIDSEHTRRISLIFIGRHRFDVWHPLLLRLTFISEYSMHDYGFAGWRVK